VKADPAVLGAALQLGHYDIGPDRSRVTFATYLDLTVEVECTRN
jgi:hypothetical protein